MAVFDKPLIISIKEARKLLPSTYKDLPDDEIERVIALLESIVRKTIKNGSI